MDADLKSIQQARELISRAREAQRWYANFTQDKVDHIVMAMAEAGAAAATELARHAHEETGFGRVESKVQKNHQIMVCEPTLEIGVKRSSVQETHTEETAE